MGNMCVCVQAPSAGYTCVSVCIRMCMISHILSNARLYLSVCVCRRERTLQQEKEQLEARLAAAFEDIKSKTVLIDQLSRGVNVEQVHCATHGVYACLCYDIVFCYVMLCASVLCATPYARHVILCVCCLFHDVIAFLPPTTCPLNIVSPLPLPLSGRVLSHSRVRSRLMFCVVPVLCVSVRVCS